ncbi:SDR family oxidoreductase [Solimonas sp. K1W22B-7]|uniref:SDR family NAD(P)-dependent oxidoreductase n=1 Tax=Solimonas sp. K1W22B-7 TaxID=2303331 RepID=UPI000E335408|nr:glucose 1-dehydrogenase [Solimonas sp. K1W22B-7]AXQ30588.1 SDR family oxidoreductase [Solimonas sp. K1W22B-7]
MTIADALFDLRGKTALITGGSRGLGKAIATAFASQGTNLVIASRKLEACVAVARELEQAHGVQVLPLGINVKDWSQCQALVEAAYERFGQVDILVNNAGNSPAYPNLESVSESLIDSVIDLNLKAPFRLMALVGTRMAAGAGGSIINISSASSIRPTAMLLHYAAAKAGLNSLTEGFAKALGPKVRVNAILAGPFATDVFAGWDPDEFQRTMADPLFLKRAGQPSEIAGAALYFASQASSFTTGALLRVDGGVP